MLTLLTDRVCTMCKYFKTCHVPYEIKSTLRKMGGFGTSDTSHLGFHGKEYRVLIAVANQCNSFKLDEKFP